MFVIPDATSFIFQYLPARRALACDLLSAYTMAPSRDQPSSCWYVALTIALAWARLTWPWDKQKQNEAQWSKLRGQLASSAALAFHEECDRHYTSRSGMVTPCKMLSSKNGRSDVMFANGGASVCSAQLSWRQAPAADRRSEQQAREQQARKQAVVEANATMQRQKERQRTAAPEQASAMQATEAEVSAVLQDPRYRQVGLTKGAAQQIAQLKMDSSKAQQEQRQGEERYKTALLKKGRQEMEGWGQEAADEGSRGTKLRQLGLAWEAVLAPSAAGKPPSTKKAASDSRQQGE